MDGSRRFASGFRLPALAAGVVFLLPAAAQQDPLAWLPLQVGARWVYENESRSGDRNRLDADRWITEVTVTEWVSTPEGQVILRSVKQQPRPEERTVSVPVIDANGQLRYVQEPTHTRGVLTALDGEPYLVRGDCIYMIREGWDAQKRALRPEYRQYSSGGQLSPDFCFPLRTGAAWGNTDIPWRVEPFGGAARFPSAEYAVALHIFSEHYGSGGWKDVWVQKGIGVVAEHYIHRGTYDEYWKKLVGYSGLR